jgi:cytochrome oxidase Cu insertion factor (SCO1/SenC/PrrC family)
MRMTIVSGAALLVIGAFSYAPVHAADAAAGGRRQRPAAPPRGSLNQRFDQAAPAIGSQVPDLTVYDADGKPFPLRQLKGDYTVLVFGCLT